MDTRTPEPANDVPAPPRPPVSGRGNLLIGVLLVLVVGGVYAYVSRPVQTPVGWSEDFNAAKRLAARDGLPLLVDFGADWCSPCRQMAHDVLPAKRVADALRGFVPVRVDVDRDRDVAASFQVQVLPTFLVLNPAGREVYRFDGYRSVEDFVAEIAKARGRLGGRD